MEGTRDEAEPAAAPMFSIVTVALDAGPALQRTADSLATQTFRGFEHVVKDGGTTDGSIARLRAPYGPRVVTAPDRGIYDGMNQAIDLCRGRFVQFLNAGDTLAGPEVLAEVAAAIERHPETQLFYCDYVHARLQLPSRLPERPSRFHMYRRTICHQAWFVARTCFEDVGRFDTRYRLSADHEFLVRAIVANDLSARRVPIRGVVYEGGGASDSRAANRIARREYDDLRARHFTRRERLLFGLAVAVTAPRVRTWLEWTPLGPAYLAIRKLVRSRW